MDQVRAPVPWVSDETMELARHFRPKVVEKWALTVAWIAEQLRDMGVPAGVAFQAALDVVRE